jgi:hypothetical protein
MKVHSLVFFLPLLGSLQAGSIPAPIVTFDMPHGGCRLLVNSDGSGSLTYGALPAWIKVKPGTFQPAALVDELRRVAIPQSDGEHPRPPGSVSFGTSEEPFLFGDKELARINFRKALSNAEAPGKMEEAGASLVEQTCREV